MQTLKEYLAIIIIAAIASKAEKLFPKSIMLHENKDIYSCQLDEVTAWLVGIGSKKDWYVWFQPQS